MARGVNKVILIGNLGQDPETRYTTGGVAVTNVNLATNESWTDKQSGQKVEKTEWHKVVFFGRSAEVISEYAKKGTVLYVEGSIETEKWQDKEGNDRYTTKVKGRNFQFLGGGEGRSTGATPERATDTGHSAPAPQQAEAVLDDEIPF